MEKISYTQREIAIAVHPLSVYFKEPCKEEIQQILDNSRYLVTLGLNIADSGYSLYINPRKEIYSPPMAPLEVIKKREFHIIEPDQFIDYARTAKNLQITLIGGEISESGVEGCVFGAYTDILRWFKSTEACADAQRLAIHLPFDALFTMHQTKFNYANPEIINAFKGQFSRSDIQEFVIKENEAIITFERKI